MDESKQKALKTALSQLTKEVVTRVSGERLSKNNDKIVNGYITLMLKEVTIRTKVA